MLVPGIEYSLVGESLMLDVGMEYNIYDMDKFEPAAFLWFEFDAKRFEKQRIGAAIWGYTRWGGNTTAAVYATWHRTVPLGLNGQVYAGVKYEADSLADVIGYVDKLSECVLTEACPPGRCPPLRISGGSASGTMARKSAPIPGMASCNRIWMLPTPTG